MINICGLLVNTQVIKEHTYLKDLKWIEPVSPASRIEMLTCMVVYIFL